MTLDIQSNLKYLGEAVQAIPSSGIKMRLKQPDYPVMLVPAGDFNNLELEMDMRHFLFPLYRTHLRSFIMVKKAPTPSNLYVMAYSSSLTNAEWAILEPLLPQILPPKKRTRPCNWTKRELIDGILYQLKNGCNWEDLPTDLPPLLAFFATFVLDSALVQQIMRWDMIILEESPWYNEILRRGEERGRQEGRQEEASALILRQLTRRIGAVSPDLQSQVRSLPLSQLEALGEALLDFAHPNDLTHWLRQHV